MRVNWLVSIILTLLMVSCDFDQDNTEVITEEISDEEIKESLELNNRRFSREERFLIDQYIERHGLVLSESISGLFYKVFGKATGDKAMDGYIAVVQSKISLLNGDVCYDVTDETLEFKIGNEDVEGGLHEGVKYMRIGEEALFILPSHLAHGLFGDFDKIPPRSPIVVEMKLVDLK